MCIFEHTLNLAESVKAVRMQFLPRITVNSMIYTRNAATDKFCVAYKSPTPVFKLSSTFKSYQSIGLSKFKYSALNIYITWFQFDWSYERSRKISVLLLRCLPDFKVQ